MASDYTVYFVRDGTLKSTRIRAEHVDEAIALAERSGLVVDHAKTRIEAEIEVDQPGKMCARVGGLLALLGWVGLPIAVGAIVLGSVAVDQSKGRRGFFAVAVGIITGLWSGLAHWFHLTGR